MTGYEASRRGFVVFMAGLACLALAVALVVAITYSLRTGGVFPMDQESGR